jgi:hypothetical protein
MIINILLAVLITTAIFTIIINTPISLGLTILLIAITTSLLFASLNSSWIAFLIFLIYIRGTLIIFAYFVAIAPNKTIFFPIQIPIIISTLPLIILLTYNSTTLINYSTFIIQTNTFYRKLSIPILIIIALILLITIIIVVKISSSTKGPLRSFNSYV